MGATNPGPTAGARPAADAASTTGLLARTRFSTWTPGWRTHLLGLACAGLLTLISVVALEPFEATDAYIVVVSGIGIAMLSVWPLGASAISLLTSCIFLLALDHGAYLSPVLPAMGPWLCTAVLLTRGFSRVGAYGLLAANVVATFVFFLLSPPNEFAVWQGYLPVLFMGATCLVVAELLRQPRMQVDAAAAQYRADLERQRLLVISELHDTVVRDLTQAVMTAVVIVLFIVSAVRRRRDDGVGAVAKEDKENGASEVVASAPSADSAPAADANDSDDSADSEGPGSSEGTATSPDDPSSDSSSSSGEED